jgi:hypothetical protein
MKVGDKVICKRGVCYHFETGFDYRISYIDDGYIFVEYGEEDFDYNCFHLRKDIEMKDDYTYKDGIYIFGDYFITNSDIRRKKLKKLNLI